eukprot:CAMPEP_0197243864 /NCGR_PEP_ID=MMETSP1429-20130617/9166_1 /TAXON_ID=49237 /ORGANISM="Chaetoceros  sp., Strain UNC1202" /LENGTH=57 /DNA_ID=CAMNT_0042704135 /DNA_START=47 /DNA_END=220 /DNA_ORIENTATION=-
MTGDTPPVKAPCISGVTISAPTEILSPQMVCTVSMNGKGTKSATSAGDASVTEETIF